MTIFVKRILLWFGTYFFSNAIRCGTYSMCDYIISCDRLTDVTVIMASWPHMIKPLCHARRPYWQTYLSWLNSGCQKPEDGIWRPNIICKAEEVSMGREGRTEKVEASLKRYEAGFIRCEACGWNTLGYMESERNTKGKLWMWNRNHLKI